MMATDIQSMKGGDGDGKRQVALAASPTEVGAFMQKNREQLRVALPKHLNPDRFIRLTLTCLSQNPDLRKCTLRSLFGEVVKAAQMGLEIGVQGQGYLVPYFNTRSGQHEAQFIPGWQGLVDLVNRSGNGTVYTGVIYRDQEYTFADGARRELLIHNETDLEDPSDITHAYAVGWVKGAAMPIIELWRVSKIEKHRDRYNKVGKRHYSFANWEMYARKIPLLQVIKYMPKSIELQRALAQDTAAETGITIDGDFMQVDEVAENGAPPAQVVKEVEALASSTTPAGEDAVDPASYSDILNAIAGSATLDQLGDAGDLIREVEDTTQHAELNAAYMARRAELENPPPERQTRRRNVD
jgi:recombination protein RecT